MYQSLGAVCTFPTFNYNKKLSKDLCLKNIFINKVNNFSKTNRFL